MVRISKAINTLKYGGVSVFGYRALSHLNLWNGPWNTVTSRYQFGTNVFDRDWDLMIILDSCRPDFLRECKDVYPWLNEVNQMRSVGSMSAEWVLKTFIEEYRAEIERTALVSRNVWSSRILDDRIHEDRDDPEGKRDQVRQGSLAHTPVTPQAFRHYERVRPEANQGDLLHPEGVAAPHIVTDRAISVARTEDIDRLIVWYAMPHLQFIAEAVDWSPDADIDDLMSGVEHIRDLTPEEESYEPAKQGKVSRKRMRTLYRQNLKLVLAYVDILLKNVDAKKAVVTADHGEGLGQQGIWGHPYGYPWPPVRTVPWAETSASDEGSYVPKYEESERELVSEERQEVLKKMGYIE